MREWGLILVGWAQCGRDVLPNNKIKKHTRHINKNGRLTPDKGGEAASFFCNIRGEEFFVSLSFVHLKKFEK
jgi:hypothetical protein